MNDLELNFSEIVSTLLRQISWSNNVKITTNNFEVLIFIAEEDRYSK